MKKILHSLVIAFVIIGLTSVSVVFAKINSSKIHTLNKDIVIEHIDVVKKYQDTISLLLKNALDDGSNNLNEKEDFLRDINYLNQQISSRLKAINSQCKIYTAGDPILSDLLTLDIILCEYRLTLVHLYQYLTIENIDSQFKSKQALFSVTTDADRKLSILIKSTN